MRGWAHGVVTENDVDDFESADTVVQTATGSGSPQDRNRRQAQGSYEDSASEQNSRETRWTVIHGADQAQTHH